MTRFPSEYPLLKCIATLVVILWAVPSVAFGQAESSGAKDVQKPSASTMPAGLLPLKDYASGFLTGDWGGERSRIAKRGITFEGKFTPIFQSVTDGGADSGSGTDLSGDLWVNIDFHRMGAIPGGLLTLRVEGNIRDSILDGNAGTLLPPSHNAILPVATEIDGDIIALSDLYYTQFLGPHFGVFLGRFDTHHNAGFSDFTGLGRDAGNTQFMNLGLTTIPSMVITEPYVTPFGAGVVVRPNDDILFTAMVMDKQEGSTRLGLDEIGEEGWNAFFAASVQYRLSGLPGGQLLGYSYTWDSSFVTLDSSQLINLIRGTPLDDKSTTWTVIYSLWQYVQVFEGDTTRPVNLNDNRPDHRGWGIFFQAGVGDEDTNPVQWSVAGGVGGRGIFSSRPNDTFGLGAFHVDLKSDVVANLIGLDTAEDGIELFYNFQVTPWFHITPDLQIVDPGISANDTAVILGLRANVNF